MNLTVTYWKSDKTSHIYKVTNTEKGTWYQVRVNPTDNTVVSCSCPHSKFRSQVCKHQVEVSRKLEESKSAPTISARDASLVNRLVRNYKSRVINDPKLRRYLSMSLSIWSSHQTSIYVEDDKYKFDDCFTASEVLSSKLGISQDEWKSIQ
ncbi:SWIM zinc finger domain-containing protein [Listeria phage LIS04]|nr:SWIM zinc finger domain-containing protein [Listeria phage LIS04]